MEENNIIQHFDGKTIFITGASGFLAKLFVEKILRVQPHVKKIFLLIRSTAKRTAEQRLREEVVNSEVFRVLKEDEDEGFESILLPKIVPVSGDVSHENLGIIDSDLREDMWREIDIIVNSAATTKFDERYDVAFRINVLGTSHVQNFARKCCKLEMLLHVSTAYVHGTREGVIQEKAFVMGETFNGHEFPKVDIEEEENIIEETLQEFQNQTEKEITRVMKDLGIQRATLHGWPNTYVFTKAMGEMLLANFKEEFNVVIIRPAIITSTCSEPFPGWIEGLRTVDSLFVAYGKGTLKFFIGDPESTIDFIPGDMVVNCMIAAIATCSNDKHDLYVYHIGSSQRNPIKYREIQWLMKLYLIRNPLTDYGGNPIRIGDPKILDSMGNFHNYIDLHYLPFLKVLEYINIMFCNYFKDLHTKARRRISQTVRLAELYKPYLFSKAIFDDVNTEQLRMTIRGSCNKNLLNFDPNNIQWDNYFVNTHFRGLAKYVLK